MGLKKIPVGPQDYPLQLVWGVPPIALSRVLFGFIKVFMFITRILLDKKSHQIIAQSNGNLFLLTPPGSAAVTGGSAGAGWLRVAPRRGLGLSCGEWPRRCASRGVLPQLLHGTAGASRQQKPWHVMEAEARKSPRRSCDRPCSEPDKAQLGFQAWAKRLHV